MDGTGVVGSIVGTGVVGATVESVGVGVGSGGVNVGVGVNVSVGVGGVGVGVGVVTITGGVGSGGISGLSGNGMTGSAPELPATVTGEVAPGTVAAVICSPDAVARKKVPNTLTFDESVTAGGGASPGGGTLGAMDAVAPSSPTSGSPEPADEKPAEAVA